MQILGIPDVVVLERIHVDLELTVIIDVHVGNEELWNEPSISLPTQNNLMLGIVLYFIWGLEAPPAHLTNF